jgi:Leucine-rich repeat (LRR) protein
VAKPEPPKNVESPAAPVEVPQPAAPARPAVDADKVMREFHERPSHEQSDETLALLASLDASHRESILKLNLSVAPISNDGVKLLAAFPNLEELNLTSTSIDSQAMQHRQALANVKSLVLASTMIDDAALVPLLDLPRLEHLSVEGCPITDEGLKTLARMKELKRLNFSSNDRATGPGLAALVALPLQSLELRFCSGMQDFHLGLLALAKCKTLVELDITRSEIRDGHLVALRAWPKLRSLKAGTNFISDQGMLLLKQQSNLDGLVELVVSNNPIGDRGVAQIGSRQLQRLDLSQTGLSDQGMVQIKRFPGLVELNISQNGIGDMGVLQLKSLKQLEVLNLGLTQVTDRGLRELVGLKSLKRIHLDKTPVTEQGRQGIQQAIPGLVVVD